MFLEFGRMTDEILFELYMYVCCFFFVCVCVKYTLVVHVTDVLVMCNMEGARCSITAFITELQRIGIVSITYLVIFSLRKSRDFSKGTVSATSISHRYCIALL